LKIVIVLDKRLLCCRRLHQLNSCHGCSSDLLSMLVRKVFELLHSIERKMTKKWHSFQGKRGVGLMLLGNKSAAFLRRQLPKDDIKGTLPRTETGVFFCSKPLLDRLFIRSIMFQVLMGKRSNIHSICPYTFELSWVLVSVYRDVRSGLGHSGRAIAIQQEMRYRRSQDIINPNPKRLKPQNLAVYLIPMHSMFWSHLGHVGRVIFNYNEWHSTFF